MSNSQAFKIAKVAKVISGALLVGTFVMAILASFLVGFVKGYSLGQINTQEAYEDFIAEVSSTTKPTATAKPVVSNKPKSTSAPQVSAFGGPQLWEAVNKRRVELGVNPLSVKEEICTIASIRLNQLLEKGSLDGHEGFSKMPESRPDL